MTKTACKSNIELTMATLDYIVIPTIIDLLFPLIWWSEGEGQMADIFPEAEEPA